LSLQRCVEVGVDRRRVHRVEVDNRRFRHVN
jgi:hypothetical protein